MTRMKDPPGTIKACRSCQAEIVWVVTEKGKAMPCDAAPANGGKFYLFRRPDKIEAFHLNSASESAKNARQRGDKLYVSHFETCPDRDEHRRAKP